MFWKPPNKEIENVFKRLNRYPVTKIDPKMSQRISRCKKIRYLSSKDKIWINKGVIGVPESVKILERKNGFDFKF